MRRKLALLGCILFTSFCGVSEEEKLLMVQTFTTFGVLPGQLPGADKDTTAQVQLGKKLFSDSLLSSNNTRSCNSCHNIQNHGIDPVPASNGVKPGTRADRNTPTVYNAALHMSQFWDGRARNLEEASGQMLLDMVAMGNQSAAVLVGRLNANEEYKRMFSKAFQDSSSVSFENLKKALAAFQRTLRTYDRFDDFQLGEYGALSAEEITGLNTFVQVGCVNCHNGPLLGANSYKKVGVVSDYTDKKDTGRVRVSGFEKDSYRFKVPSLRNVANTAPYFHDGAVKTLPGAVKLMAAIQLGTTLSQQQVGEIITFLQVLSDQGKPEKPKKRLPTPLLLGED